MSGHVAKAAALLGGEDTVRAGHDHAGRPARKAEFGLSGPAPSERAPIGSMPNAGAPAKADEGVDVGAILKILMAGQAAAAPAQAAADAAPPPLPTPQKRPSTFDATRFFSMLPAAPR